MSAPAKRLRLEDDAPDTERIETCQTCGGDLGATDAAWMHRDPSVCVLELAEQVKMLRAQLRDAQRQELETCRSAMATISAALGRAS